MGDEIYLVLIVFIRTKKFMRMNYPFINMNMHNKPHTHNNAKSPQTLTGLH